MNEDIILEMAKAIQLIEHQGWHSWKTCTKEARDRAMKQAMACAKIASQQTHPANAELTCECCGRKETPPYAEGDLCYCGERFRAADL